MSLGEFPLLGAAKGMSPPGGDGAFSPRDATAVEVAERRGAMKATVGISGMTCTACTSAVERTLRNVRGVKSVSVVLLRNTAEVEFEPDDVEAEELVSAIEQAGFDAQLLSVSRDTSDIKVYRMRITGMMCTTCTSAVEMALRECPGVHNAKVGLALGEAEVECDGGVSEEKLLATVTALGFEAVVFDTSSPHSVSIEVSGMSNPKCAETMRSLKKQEGVLDVTISKDKDASSGQDRAVVEVRYNPDVTGPRDFMHRLKGLTDLGCTVNLQDASAWKSRLEDLETNRLRRLFITSLVFSLPVFILAIILPRVPGAHEAIATQVGGIPIDVLLKWVLTTPVQFIIGYRFHTGAARALMRCTADMNVLVSLGTNAAYVYSLISVLTQVIGNRAGDDFNATDFFETSALLVTFIILGKYLETMAKRKTSEAISSLLNLIPDSAMLVSLGKDSEVVAEEEILAALVHKGDYLKVYPFARIPADGIVVSGSSHVDESMITGESEPVRKRTNSAVIGGTVNTSGVLIIRSTRIGSDTTLSQIVRLVERAQMAQAPIQKLADGISSYFVPFVLCVAVITWVAWYSTGVLGTYPEDWIPESHGVFLFALLFSIAVLVIACPCALGLATPTAVMVGTGVGARLGILIKGGDALEKGHKVDTIIFDKTGTLTAGRPQVVHHACFHPAVPSAELAALASAVESRSEHPLAKAIMNFARTTINPGPASQDCDAADQIGGGARDMSWVRAVREVDVRPGMGVVGRTAGKTDFRGAEPSGAEGVKLGDGSEGCEVRVAVGNAALMEELGVEVAGEVTDYLEAHQSQGHTCVLVACQAQVVGAVSIADPPKPRARAVVAALEARGVECHMVTGDNWRTARAVANKLGISRVKAEVMPAWKANKVTELQAGGRVVAMVGDGVNDAPALVAADVGMAIGSGTDTAIEAADFVLMRDNIEDVLTAVDLAVKTFRRIQLNFLWAFAYNVMMIPIAAGALYPEFQFQLPPWIAGVAMALSSVSVVCSSLALKRYRRPQSPGAES